LMVTERKSSLEQRSLEIYNARDGCLVERYRLHGTQSMSAFYQ